MSQDTGQRAAEQVIYSEDELSIDDLDRIVGGLNSENPSGEGGSPSGEGGYTPPPPPVVHAPDHLPTEINQVEVNVATNHSITGDQAISQIAGIIGSQTDDHQQSIAGAEIASALSRHGANVSVSVQKSGGTSVDDMIQNRIAETGADLLVLGAYSHSWLRQLLFGGVTRTVLRTTQVAAFLSR